MCDSPIINVYVDDEKKMLSYLHCILKWRKCVDCVQHPISLNFSVTVYQTVSKFHVNLRFKIWKSNLPKFWQQVHVNALTKFSKANKSCFTEPSNNS